MESSPVGGLKKMSDCAIVVVDMIRDFVNGRPPQLPAPSRGREVVVRTRKLLEAARKTDVPVVYVSDRFSVAEKDAAIEFKLWGPHAIEGDPGTEIDDEVSPQSKDRVLHKKRYDGFFGTSLDLQLREIQARQLFFCGLQTDCCVLQTALGAFYRGYEVVVVSDACDTSSPEGHRRGLDYLRTYAGAEVIESADAIKRLLAAMEEAKV
jgi:nicotinamidase-related amidase